MDTTSENLGGGGSPEPRSPPLNRNQFLVSSPKLKAQVNYSDRPLSVVRLSVNFDIFEFFSRTTGPIVTKVGTNP